MLKYWIRTVQILSITGAWTKLLNPPSLHLISNKNGDYTHSKDYYENNNISFMPIISFNPYIIVLLWQNILNMKFTILTSFKCTASTFKQISYHHPAPDPKVKLHIHLKNNSPFSVSPGPGNHPSPFVSMNLTTLGALYKWDHTVFVFLCLVYDVFKAHPCCSMCQNFLPF